MDFDCLLKHVSGTLGILVDVIQPKPGHTQPREVNSWKNIPMKYNQLWVPITVPLLGLMRKWARCSGSSFSG